MDFFTKIISLFTGNKNSSNQEDTLELIKRKVNELELQIKGTENEIKDNKDDVFRNLIPTLLLIYDYTADLMKNIQNSNSMNGFNSVNEIIEQLKLNLEYNINDKPLNVLLGKLFNEFSDIEYKFKDVNSIDELVYAVKNEKDKLKIINELENKLQDIVTSNSLDYSQYKVLEQLHRTFPIARRIQNIYIQSILQTDLFSNDYLLVKENKEKFQDYYPELIKYNDEYEVLAEKIQTILKKLRRHINEHDLLKNKILNYATKYGICFVEILHKEEFLKTRNPNLLLYQNIDKIIKEEIITENIEQLKTLINTTTNIKISEKQTKIVEHILDSTITNLVDLSISEDIIDENEEIIAEENIEENDLFKILDSFDIRKLDKIKIIIHKPYNVIPIHDGNNTIYAYLVIDKSLLVDKSSKDEILEKLARIFTEVNTKQIKYSQVGTEMLNTITDYFIQNIDKQLKKLLQLSQDKTLKEKLSIIDNLFSEQINSTNSELYTKLKYNIYQYLLEFLTNKTLTKLKVRLVLPRNMVRFYLKESEFPYGESVLADIVLHSILYLISVYSNIVNRVSRSSLYRVWRINPGVLKSKTSQIYKLISYIKSKPITINDLGDITKIPNIITAYRDVIQVIDNTGQPAVDLSINRAGDPTVRIQDIQDYKMDIAMLSGIPSQRLGIQDNYELREKLVQTSLQFAETISNMQDTLVKQLIEFYDKILKVSHPRTFGKLEYNIFNFIDINFHKPIQLKLLYLESVFSSVNNIVGILSQIPVIKDNLNFVKLLKQLIPFIDWEELIEPDINKEVEIRNLVNSNGNQQDDNQSSSTTGGLF